MGTRSPQVLCLQNWDRAPLAFEAVRRIDEIFAIERKINSTAAERRVERTAAAYNRSLAILNNGCVPNALGCHAMPKPRLTNNAAERALRGTAIGRKAWLFAASAAAASALLRR